MARKKMGETRRRQILEGLLVTVAEHGLLHFNMSQVAAASGVSRGILHYYFKNKEEMIGALMAHVRDRLIPRYRELADRIGTPADKLRRSLWYPVEAVGSRGISLARIWIEFWGMAAHNAGIRAFILEVQREVRHHFQECIEQGQASGVFSREARADRVAVLILSALEGLMLQWHYQPDTFSFAGSIKELQRMLQEHLSRSVS